MTGFDGEEPTRLVLDVLLGAIGVVASLILFAFAFEKHPTSKLAHYAVGSAITLFIVLAASKWKAGVLAGIIFVISIRGIIAAAFYHFWPGLLISAAAWLICFLLLKWSRTPEY